MEVRGKVEVWGSGSILGYAVSEEGPPSWISLTALNNDTEDSVGAAAVLVHVCSSYVSMCW